MREPRLRSLLLVLALVGAPAAILRVACVGDSCPVEDTSTPRVPFCDMPADFRDLVEAGFRDGRSPEVLAAAAPPGVAAPVGEDVLAWPGTGSDTRVPLVFSGPAIRPVRLPAGVTLDRVAPTVEALLGITRPFPGVRSGTAVDGVVTGTAPLVVEIVWKGVGTPDLEAAPDAWPVLRRTIARGAGSTAASTGALPIDPAAAMATIGTGGLPAQHGVTGTLLRNDSGDVVGAWSTRAPISVIATLGDDLDERTGGAARIGLVGGEERDRGLIGGSWYVAGDRDDVVLAGDPVREVRRLLHEGYGADHVPDLLAVALDGRLPRLDRTTAALLALVTATRPDAAVVVAGTGTSSPDPGAVEASALEAQLDDDLAPGLVEAFAGDGVFVDATVAAGAGIGADPIARSLARTRVDGRRVLEDAYPAFAVALSRYC